MSPEISLAPMLAVTTTQFRTLIHLTNPNIVLFTEMIVAETVLYSTDANLRERLGPINDNTVVQIGGGNSKTVVQAVKRLKDLGYQSFNLNCGCPSSKVKKGSFGAVLMLDVERVIDILNKVFEECGVVMSVKCRIGVICDEDKKGALNEENDVIKKETKSFKKEGIKNELHIIHEDVINRNIQLMDETTEEGTNKKNNTGQEMDSIQEIITSKIQLKENEMDNKLDLKNIEFKKKKGPNNRNDLSSHKENMSLIDNIPFTEFVYKNIELKENFNLSRENPLKTLIVPGLNSLEQNMKKDTEKSKILSNEMDHKTISVLSDESKPSVNTTTFEFFYDFVFQIINKTRTNKFYVHARTCILNGFNPKQNRQIPPLRWDYVYKIKQLLPHINFYLNGGIKDRECLKGLDGIMIGREAKRDVLVFKKLEQKELEENPETRKFYICDLLNRYLDSFGTGICQSKHILPIMGLMLGLKGAGKYKILLNNIITKKMEFSKAKQKISDFFKSL